MTLGLVLRMVKAPKEPEERIHFIPEWAEYHHMTQADVLRDILEANPDLGLNKSTRFKVVFWHPTRN